jgi:hypothetical protein
VGAPPPRRDGLALAGPERGALAQGDARIRARDVEGDPVELALRTERRERRRAVGEAGPCRLGVRDVLGRDPVDRLDGEQARAGLERAARTDRRPAPAAERDGHLAPADRVQVPGPEEH